MEGEALARAVIAKLRGAGHQAYLVAARCATCFWELSPRISRFDRRAPRAHHGLFPKSGQVGAHFGVVLVRDAGAQVEVATFRSDHEYSDGRRPASVHFETDRAAMCCAAISPSTG